MFRFASCLAVLAMLVVLVVLVVLVGVGEVWAVATPGTGIMLFDEPTDTISVSGQTVIGTASTYEARVLFTDTYVGYGSAFQEWTRNEEGKMFQVGPNALYGKNFDINSSLQATPSLTTCRSSPGASC
ncbi:MAG: hypothetical protein HQ567_00755 [Candidatus Nealsonbacteria bacterium]|nr:hypothetical protein [Candidatus Nealsonbacteria bacterium]